MTVDPSKYSTIRKEPIYKPADGYSLSAFYEKLTSPAAIVGVLVAYCVLLNQEDLGGHFEKALAGDLASATHISLLLLSLVAGLRMIQSVYLAKRDYAHLEHSFMDVAIFLAFLLFASGAVLQAVKINYAAVLIIYAFCALVGTVNFAALWLWRIPRHSIHFDYPIERRIQAVNTGVFAALTVALAWQGALVLGGRESRSGVFATVGFCALLLVFHMIHSNQLTLLPKFLFTNETDAPDRVMETVRQFLSHLPLPVKEEGFRLAVLGEYETSFRGIRTERVGKADAGFLVAELIQSFGYVYSYVFDSTEEWVLERSLRTLLLSGFGFGPMGYMSFYWIVNEQGERVGILKLDTAHRNWVYRSLGAVVLPFRLALVLGPRKLIGTLRRVRSLLRIQSQPRDQEIRLTYLIIFDDFRKRGYGRAILYLIRNACLYTFTNDIVAERITLYVREKNRAANRLFEAAGFTAEPAHEQPVADPLSGVAGKGVLRKLELRGAR